MTPIIQGLMIGVIFSTGVYMMFKNCIAPVDVAAVNVRALLVTVLLIGSISAYRKVTKKKLSPIWLIVISAIFGVIIY